MGGDESFAMGELAFFSTADVEKYGYCPLSWWLSQEEQEENLAQALGQKEHERIASELVEVQTTEHRAHESEVTVLSFALGATFISLLGVAIFSPQLPLGYAQVFDVISLIWVLAATYFLYRGEKLLNTEDRLVAERLVLLFSMVATVVAVLSVALVLIKDSVLGRILEVMALLWLWGATFFMYRGIRHLEKARERREALKLQEGRVEYIDTLEKNPELFVSERYGLRGRPDFILEQKGEHIPVEVKTGRTPQGPLFSHILQVAAHCLLIEETHGRPPPYGIVKYPDGQHQIEYNDDLRKLVLAKLEGMREARRLGEAHRNHNRPGKCLNCSRRPICPERLA